MRPVSLLIASLSLILVVAADGAELIRLNKDNWKEFAPRGKEVDCIYGDFVLRNDKIVAVIADPLPTRNANMTVRNVGGKLIDLTSRNAPNDQLSLYAPMGVSVSFHSPSTIKLEADGQPVALESLTKASGDIVAWECSADANGTRVTVRYELQEGQPFVRVTSTLRNKTDEAQKVSLMDAVRADRTFKFNASKGEVFTFHDDWFRQAYAVRTEGFRVQQGGSRGATLRLEPIQDQPTEIPANGQLVIQRQVIPAPSVLALRGRMNMARPQEQRERLGSVQLSITDAQGGVPQAKVTLAQDKTVQGTARSNVQGKIWFGTTPGTYQITVEAVGRKPVTQPIEVTRGKNEVRIELPESGYVVGKVVDEAGRPSPCKVAFHGLDGTATPDFGPDSAHTAIKNVHYSHDGKFRQQIAPGKYEVIVSLGPEYDAVFQMIDVKAGQEVEVAAKMQRVVNTTGWISSDFHSHSSPSGDNTGSQFGRVQNLLCEHIEFAPCTEHNRISTYVPHIKRLKAESRMQTCPGMELTGSPLPINHQNAFPLRLRPRFQDGGGPVTDANPIAQIERLALWDQGSEKLVQENHPNLLQILNDRDLDGKRDSGFEKMFEYMDVVEVHPPAGIFQKPEPDKQGKLSRNPIYHWMQLLNLGYRITGVVNTDAHYNYHESGWLRNYIQSDTDQPAEIQPLNVVRAAKAGHVVMTSGPFLEVSMQAGDSAPAPPGSTVVVADGKAMLHVRVQCPNWIDINRVQVFVNGRAEKRWNFTRREHATKFSNEVVRFDQQIPISVDKDAHIIVATIGEGLKLGRVMGPRFGELPPCAVSNPIFLDADGKGFQANGDLLDVPIAE